MVNKHIYILFIFEFIIITVYSTCYGGSINKQENIYYLEARVLLSPTTSFKYTLVNAGNTTNNSLIVGCLHLDNPDMDNFFKWDELLLYQYNTNKLKVLYNISNNLKTHELQSSFITNPPHFIKWDSINHKTYAIHLLNLFLKNVLKYATYK